MTALTCPGCSGKMRSFQAGAHELDRCTFCSGLWFDGGELQAVLGKRPAASLTQDQESSRRCPRCTIPMTPAVVGGLRVEFCTRCQGVFLDDGELTALNGGQPVKIQVQAGTSPQPPARPEKQVQDDLMSWLDTLGA
jgi:Zn-finger nucleic acid-binding protein